MTENAASGFDALFTGAAHCYDAIAVKPTWGWRVPEASLRQQGRLPDALPVDRRASAFRRIAAHLDRLP